ncbi:Fanconi anemia group M protein, partial [Silurus asotus]
KMSSANQKTLFQTWGSAVPKTTLLSKDLGKKLPQKRRTKARSSSQVKEKQQHNVVPSLFAEIDQGHEMDEVDDDLILVAVYEAEKSLETQPALPPDTSITDSSEVSSDLLGFDSSSGRIWIYPSNFPIRDYQLKISEAALFQNTLVCLPTGLGKTFIASVVMYNFYRWYPAGKIVFLAPTKPLVAQQIEACYRVMGISQQHMAELTGSTPAPQRRELWRSRRVFFLTPQVMVNDLSRNTCPAPQIKCVVIDEAHKASGNHAYCQVVRELWNQTKQFRVLALSATPGADMKAVQQVIFNLLISHIELRSEESPDVQAHSHQRTLDKIVVPLGESLTGYQSRYIQVLERFTSRLTQMSVLNLRDLRSLTKYQVILAREQFRRNPSSNLTGAQHGALEGDFALCISLYHGYELLQQMGLRSLFLFAQNIMSGSKETSRARNELQRCPVFMDLYREMETMFLDTTKGRPGDQFFYSHPKLQKLDEVIQQHFNDWEKRSEPAAKAESTRVMIFSSFRESVQEIAEMLNRHQPRVRVMTFMGQASAGKGVRGFTQKEQLEVVRRFREGGFNTLVSTCVGEEGLDIGEVDLIVCFDAQKSPIRLVQRMGRTGRHRQGRIVVILAEGREERTYNQSQSNRRSVNKCIMGSKHSFSMFPHSPRMLPAGVTPMLHKMHITCGQFEVKESNRRSSNVRQSLGRGSLLELDAQDGLQGHVKDDGFLSPAGEAEWLSTMKLGENEAQPRLQQSSFLCFNTDPQPEKCVNGPVRDLSLWEWRHWQNQPLPTHKVDHSSRCLHFTAIMELIDQMRQEEEGSGCRYESEVKAYLQKTDVVGFEEDGTIAKPTNPRSKRSKPGLVGRAVRHSVSKTNLDKEDQVGPSSRTLLNHKASSESECDATTEGLNVFCCDYVDLANDSNTMQTDAIEHPETNPSRKDEQTHGSPEHTKGLQTNPDEDIGELFYLPKWNVCQKLKFSQSSRNLETILSNVKRLLSRSPPECFDLQCSISVNKPSDFHESDKICSSPNEELDQFQVNFDLEEFESSLDSDSVDCNIARAVHEAVTLPHETVSAGSDGTANSPSWDEVFEDVVDDGADKNANPPSESKVPPRSFNESVDLFGDDEAFLQISLPNIETPHKDTVIPIIRQDTEQKKPSSEQRSATFNCSQDIFSVNFDLGFSFDSEEEEPAEPIADMTAEPIADNKNTFTLLTLNEPNTSSNSLGHMSTPRMGPMGKKLPSLIVKSNLSPIIIERESLMRPKASTPDTFVSSENRNLGLFSKISDSQARGNRLCRRSLLDPGKPCSVASYLFLFFFFLFYSGLFFFFRCIIIYHMVNNHFGDRECLNAECFFYRGQEIINSDSEEESVIRKPGRQGRANPLASPEVRIIAKRGKKKVLHLSFLPLVDLIISKKAVHRSGRQFLDEEAELSEEGGSVSSDECDGEELEKSLEGFVVDNTQFSQGLNDSEMHGVYLKSVKSPAISSKFQMVHRPRHNLNIFSQVPEQDETYEEDSFVVNGSEVEEDASSASDEEEIVPEDSYVDGRRQYATRRRVHQKQNAGAERMGLTRKATKRSRILRVDDSSEGEQEKDEKKKKTISAKKLPFSESAPGRVLNTPPRPRLHECDPEQAGEEKSPKDAALKKQETDRPKLSNQVRVSEKLHFLEPSTTSLTPAGVCVLVDSRCISAGANVVSALRLKHGAAVHICSLGSCDFIVSNRMAVEWQSESELGSAQNRKRLRERMQNLQGLFERVCLLVEKDRTKPGETLRQFQRSRYYDSTVAALVRAGVRLLFSSGPDDTAALLAQLAQVEQRKGKAIDVPVEVKGRRQQALQFYLTLPCVNYVNALYMCYRFYSVAHLINSSVDTLQSGLQVSRSKAEEIHRCLRYSCDTTLMKGNT